MRLAAEMCPLCGSDLMAGMCPECGAGAFGHRGRTHLFDEAQPIGELAQRCCKSGSCHKCNGEKYPLAGMVPGDKFFYPLIEHRCVNSLRSSVAGIASKRYPEYSLKTRKGVGQVHGKEYTGLWVQRVA